MMDSAYPGLKIAAVTTAAIVVAALAGVPLGGSAMLIVACAAILMFGLPHGALDIEVIRGAGQGGMAAVLGVYLGIAAATALLWWAVPIVALAAFLVIAAAHFAEDWDDARSRFLSVGTAVALIAAPTLLHRSAVAAIFVALTDQSAAARLADVLMLTLPVALPIAVVGIAAMIAAGRRGAAVAAATSLTALIALPPAVGFAVFFCLFHSPRHFVVALHAARRWQVARWLPVVVPVTALALALVAAIYLARGGLAFPLRLTSATFMALAILTVPHMLAPTVVRRLATLTRTGFPAHP